MQMKTEAEQKKKATGPKKPIEETSRVPNTPWMNLVADDDNDINFEVDQKFKFRIFDYDKDFIISYV